MHNQQLICFLGVKNNVTFLYLYIKLRTTYLHTKIPNQSLLKSCFLQAQLKVSNFTKFFIEDGFRADLDFLGAHSGPLPLPSLHLGTLTLAPCRPFSPSRLIHIRILATARPCSLCHMLCIT